MVTPRLFWDLCSFKLSDRTCGAPELETAKCVPWIDWKDVERAVNRQAGITLTSCTGVEVKIFQTSFKNPTVNGRSFIPLHFDYCLTQTPREHVVDMSR